MKGTALRRSAVALGQALLALAIAPTARAVNPTQNFNSWPISTNWGSYTNSDGWILTEGQVQNFRNPWGGTPRSSPAAGWLRDASVSTNASLTSPRLSYDVSAVHLWAYNAVTGGYNVLAIQTSTDDVSWTTAATLTNTLPGWTMHARAIPTPAPCRVRLLKTADSGPDQYLGLDDVELLHPDGVSLANLRHTPPEPEVDQVVDVWVDAAPLPSTSNLLLHTLYRLPGQTSFTAVAMSAVSGVTSRTAAPLVCDELPSWIRSAPRRLYKPSMSGKRR